MKDIKKAISRSCRERDSRSFKLEGLGRTEMMNTRGFKDGRKSWIDVMPAGGPKMRVTHEVLEGFASLKTRKQYAQTVARKAREEEYWEKLAQKDAERVEARRGFLDKNDAEAWDPRVRSYRGLEGLGSSFALMWAAAGAAALLVLSNAQQPAYAKGLAPDPAREIILNDLNRARAAQGLPPLPR